MTLFKFIVWVLIHYAGYFFGELFLKKCKCRESIVDKLSSCVDFDSDDDFQIEHDDLNFAKRADTLLRIFYQSIIPFYLADVPGKMNSVESLLYLIPFFLIIPLFGVLGQCKGLQTSCSVHSCKEGWPWQSIVAYTLSTILVVFDLIWNTVMMPDDNILSYWLSILISSAFVGLLYLYAKQSDGTFHVHHWYIGFFGSLLNVTNDPVSTVYFMTLQGLYIEEAVDFRLFSLFSDGI